MTISDLAQIGSHNKREKKAYNSNPDIDIEGSKDNIELVLLSDKYVKGFYNLVKDYRKEHEERMKIEREDIKDKIHLSELQDKYHKRLTDKSYDLERGIKDSDRKHIKIKDYKK